MDLKPTYKKPQFLAQIAGAFLVILCCIALPTRVGAFSLSDGLASIASFWQGVTCFFGINCPAVTTQIPSASNQVSDNNQYLNENTNKAIITGDTNNNASAIDKDQTSVPPAAGYAEDRPSNADTNTNTNPTIVQNINPTKEIQTKEIQTVKTIETKINTVVADQDLRDQVTRLMRQLDSDRPSYSIGQTFTMPANIGGTTLNIGSGNFTADSSGNLITNGTLTIQGNLILSNTATITANSTAAALAVSNTGSGHALTVDNLTLKTNTLSTATGNLILNSNTGLIEVAGSGIKITSSVPGDTAMALYNDSGTLKWNGAALALGSSVSGTTGYMPKFTASNALGNSAIFEDSGLIGIGTTAPAYPLDVSATGGTKAFRFTNSIGSYTLDQYSLTAPSSFYIASPITLALQAGAGDGVKFIVAANERMRINTSGNVGIGTTAPAYKLDVASGDIAIESTGKLVFPKGGSYTYLNESWGISYRGDSIRPFQITNSGLMVGYTATGANYPAGTVSISGNVGIGTTAPAYKLDVIGNLNASATSTFMGNVGVGVALPYTEINLPGTNSDVGGIMYGNINTTGQKTGRLKVAGYTAGQRPVTMVVADANSLYNKISVGGGSGWENAATELNFYTAPALNTVTGTARMTIDGSGNVGIGTTTPGHGLDVETGSIKVNNGINGAGSSGTIYLGDGSLTKTYGSGWTISGGVTQSGGSGISAVGLAISGSPGTLFVSGQSTFNGASFGGNVGIGTTTPNKLLVLSQSNNGTNVEDGKLLRILSASAVNARSEIGFGWYNHYSNHDPVVIGYQITSTSSYGQGNFYVATRNSTADVAPSQVFTIDSSGNVGIGTTAPTVALDVVGSIKATGSLTAGTTNKLIFAEQAASGEIPTGIFGGSNANGYSIAAGGTIPGTAKLGGYYYNGSGWNSAFEVSNTTGGAAGNLLLMKSSGNVGIGTTAPTGKFTIQSNGDGEIISVKSNYTGNNKIFEVKQEASDGMLYLRSASNVTNVKLSGYATTPSYILNNIGIGTTSPSAYLHLKAGTSVSSTAPLKFTSGTNTTIAEAGALEYDGTRLWFTNGNLARRSFATEQYLQSRGQNLVTNGSGLLGDNTNFSSFTFDQVETYGGGGSFRININTSSRVSDEYIPVDPGQTYRQTVVAKAGDLGGGNFNAANRQYVGVALYDIDFNIITSNETSKIGGSTDTTLASTLNPGDTTVTLTNATGWNNDTNVMANQFIWYGYANSKGYVYPDYTYSRNESSNYSSNNTLGTWVAGGISGNTITLRVPWAGPAIPAGMAIRNTRSNGGTYKYMTLAFQTIPNMWTKYEGYIGGLESGGVEDVYKFRPGTAYVKMLFLVNYHGAADTNVRYNNVWFSELSSKNLEAAAAGVPGVVSLTAQTLGAGDKYFSANVGIGTTAPAQKLHVYRATDGAPVRFEDANGYCEIDPTTTTWTCTSDASMKTDVTGLSAQDMLQKIISLQGVNFRWKTQATDALRYGFIAQDVEKIFPEFVTTDENGLKSVAYGAFTPAIIEAIKYQQKQIDGLKLVLGPTGALGDASSTSDLALGNANDNWLVNSLKSLGLALKDGVANLKEMIASKITSNEIITDQMCVKSSAGEKICLNGDQLKELLQNTGTSNTITKTYLPAENDADPDVAATTTAELEQTQIDSPLGPDNGEAATTTEGTLGL